MEARRLFKGNSNEINLKKKQKVKKAEKLKIKIESRRKY